MSHHHQYRTFAGASLLSLREIAAQLQQIGRPPSPFRASSTATEVVRIVAALGINASLSPSETLAVVSPTLWSTRLEPWIKGLLIATLIAYDDPNPSNNAYTLRDDVLHAIPDSLSLLFHVGAPFTLAEVEPGEDALLLTNQIQYLFTRVWLATIRDEHPASKSWSILLINLFDGDVIHAHSIRAFSAKDIPSFARYTRSRIPRLSLMNLREGTEFAGFIYVFATITLESKTSTLDGSKHCQEAVAAAIPVLVSLLSKVLRVRSTSARDKDSFLDSLTLSTTFILVIALDGAKSISEALACGLLSTLLKRPHLLATLPAEALKSWRALLEKVSRFVVHPMVFHEFSHVVRRWASTRDDYDMWLPRDLWCCWKDCLARAAYVYAIRQRLKARGVLYRCSASTCTNTNVVNYKSCFTCGAFYCSQACQVLDWRSGHRARCSVPELYRNRAAQDLHFFRSVVAAYLADNRADIVRDMESYLLQLQQQPLVGSGSFQDDTELIVTRRKYPILLFDLNMPNIPAPKDCIKFVSTITYACAYRPYIETDILPAWRETEKPGLSVVICLPDAAVDSGDVKFTASFNLLWP
ncbi:hypothetical protein V5O48_001824 [Marasmius crinis-equi]|uniref:MYND-type domain-containing protein n=1 Tax=Marasmius crinis-equi TaxID=585013 RepID=A0ABR3FXA4_9AGAR